MKKYLLLILKLILISISVALVISLYQYLAHLVIEGSHYLLLKGITTAIITIIIAVLASFSLMYANKLLPGYYGSGIPQIEAYHRGWYRFSPFKMLALIFLNSLYAFFTGFSLGSEGPSISMGTSIGMIYNKIFKAQDKESEACAGSAGFAVAFMSPLAGLCHLIEENKKIFKPSLLLKGIIIISISFIISYFVYNHSLLPHFDVGFLPLKYYLLLLALILICVIASKLYMLLIVKIKDITKHNKMMLFITPILVIGFMILRRFEPILSGNGANALELNVMDYSLIIIFIILLFKLLATALSTSACVSGGLVLPMLAVGALCSFLLVKAYSFYDPNILNYLEIFIVCGMLIVFAVVTKAPLTAFVLGLKCAPIKVIVLPLLMTIGISYLLVILFKWDNIYHQLEKRLNGYYEHQQDKTNEIPTAL